METAIEMYQFDEGIKNINSCGKKLFKKLYRPSKSYVFLADFLYKLKMLGPSTNLLKPYQIFVCVYNAYTHRFPAQEQTLHNYMNIDTPYYPLTNYIPTAGGQQPNIPILQD